MGLLRDLTLRKPPKQLTFLNTLLAYTTYESNVVRDAAIGHVLDLHKHFELKLIIEEFAKMNMEFLKVVKVSTFSRLLLRGDGFSFRNLPKVYAEIIKAELKVRFGVMTLLKPAFYRTFHCFQ